MDEFSQPEIYNAVQSQNFPHTLIRIESACDRLVLAGILKRSGPKFQFANSIFPLSLRANYNLPHLLSVLKEEGGF
jgi:hypothetical protein